VALMADATNHRLGTPSEDVKRQTLASEKLRDDEDSEKPKPHGRIVASLSPERRSRTMTSVRLSTFDHFAFDLGHPGYDLDLPLPAPRIQDRPRTAAAPVARLALLRGPTGGVFEDRRAVAWLTSTLFWEEVP